MGWTRGQVIGMQEKFFKSFYKGAPSHLLRVRGSPDLAWGSHCRLPQAGPQRAGNYVDVGNVADYNASLMVLQKSFPKHQLCSKS